MDSIPATFCCHLNFAPKAKPSLPLRAHDRSESYSYLTCRVSDCSVREQRCPLDGAQCWQPPFTTELLRFERLKIRRTTKHATHFTKATYSDSPNDSLLLSVAFCCFLNTCVALPPGKCRGNQPLINSYQPL